MRSRAQVMPRGLQGAFLSAFRLLPRKTPNPLWMNHQNPPSISQWLITDLEGKTPTLHCLKELIAASSKGFWV